MNNLLALQVQQPNIDVGSSVARGQDVQSARLGNLLTQFKLRQAQQADQATQAKQAMFSRLGPGLANGDPNALSQYATVDPQGAMDFRSKATEQSGANLDLIKKRVDFIAPRAQSILQAPEAARPLLYARMLQEAKDHPDVGVNADAPPQYDENYVKGLASRALTVQQQIANKRQAETDSPDYKGKVAGAEAAAKFPYEQRLAQTKADATAAAGGDFGRGMTGKAYNILAQGLKNPVMRSTPEYATAWQILSNPKVDPNTGTIIRPDLSAFAPPTGAGGQPGAPGQRTPTLDAFAPPNPSQADSASAGYANRLSASAGIIDKMEGALTDPSETMKSKVPLVGNYMVNSQFQQGDQAARNFINAQLRRESGAAISESEFDNARKQYLPQPGDSKEVLSQKKAARQMAVRNMQLSAGNVLLPPGVIQHASPPPNAPIVPQEQGFGGPDTGKVIDFNDLPKGGR